MSSNVYINKKTPYTKNNYLSKYQQFIQFHKNINCLYKVYSLSIYS